MAIRRYTREQLLKLRESPLVQKPANLPVIEQWIDEAQQQAQAAASKRQPSAKTGGESSPMGNFSTGLRPSLLPRASKAGANDDVSLGPPRTMFPSSKNVTKLSDQGDVNEPSVADEHETVRSRFFGERSSQRKSFADREGESGRDSWTTIRERRQGGRDEGEGKDRYDRPSRRDRDQEGERRNGLGEKSESRWVERRQNGDRTGGWRDRERQRKEPEWMSGGQPEKNPEWMDDSPSRELDDDVQATGMSKRAEDFQKWKDERRMKDSNGKQPEPAIPPTEEPPPQSPPPKEPTSKPAATLKLEGFTDKPFGNWTEVKTVSQEGTTTPGKSTQAAAKAKSSRFASMFKESHGKEEAQTIETSATAPLPAALSGSAEDEAGFNRILKMLGSTGLGQAPAQEGPTSPLRKQATNGSKQQSHFAGFFEQNQRSPEQVQLPHSLPPGLARPQSNELNQLSRGMTSNDGQAAFGGKLPSFAQNEQIRILTPTNARSSEPPGLSNGSREQNMQSGSLANLSFDQQPPRNAASPDMNIQNLLAGQRSQKTHAPDKNSEFLLNLLQTKGSRTTPQPARPDNNFPLWLDQPPNLHEQHDPKTRAPAPFDDQGQHNRLDEARRRQLEQARVPDSFPRQEAQRAPPGFFDDRAFALQQQQQHQVQQQALLQSHVQRRNFVEAPLQSQPNRRPGPPQNLPQMSPLGSEINHFNSPPPDFLQSLDVPHQAPPPGFNPHMIRHPPGFYNIPNIFQQMPQQQQQHGRDGIGPFSPRHGGQMQATSPVNAPPGFFGASGAPPGMLPGIFGAMRGPNDPSQQAGLRGGMKQAENAGMYDGGMSGARQ